MKRTRISPVLGEFPAKLHVLLEKFPVYDSSCSKEAKVWFVDGDGGFYLKAAPAGTLKTEAEMTRYFHSKGLGAEVMNYLPLEQDWLLTRKIPGEDCVFPKYTEDPKRLCDTTATLLRQLHETDYAGCPVMNRCDTYRAKAEQGHRSGYCELDLFPLEYGWGFSSAEEAWQMVQSNQKYLKNDTLLHGDYCLPNIMLNDWNFSGFIDLDCSGVGDRHIDIFWGAWTLFFNLKTNAYYDRFLDAYGRDRVEPELLRTVAALEELG